MAKYRKLCTQSGCQQSQLLSVVPDLCSVYTPWPPATLPRVV